MQRLHELECVCADPNFTYGEVKDFITQWLNGHQAMIDISIWVNLDNKKVDAVLKKYIVVPIDSLLAYDMAIYNTTNALRRVIKIVKKKHRMALRIMIADYIVTRVAHRITCYTHHTVTDSYVQ